MSTDGEQEAQELLARQQEKCREIIAAHPGWNLESLMLLAVGAGFQIGANYVQSRVRTALAIKSAKA